MQLFTFSYVAAVRLRDFQKQMQTNLDKRNSPPFVFLIKIIYFHIFPPNYTQLVYKIY